MVKYFFTVHHILTSVLILSCIKCVSAQDRGWRADPERIEYLEEQHPEFNWREVGVPDYQLPKPLNLSDGSKVKTKKDWRQRRSEILDLFRTHMYGYRPGRPEELSFDIIEENRQALDGRATLRRIDIKSKHKGRNHEFKLVLFLPNQTPKPVPVFLLINNRNPNYIDPSQEEYSGFWPVKDVITRGYGIAAIQNDDLAPDNKVHYSEGVIKLFEGEKSTTERDRDAWMALAAWGWGASRVMDYFETVPNIDTSKVALIGHSRAGKASLWAGAEDERFSLVISNNSGSGGTALSRREFGETLQAVNSFSHWFAENYNAFEGREAALPFDQHMLLSLIAPRAVYVASADQDLWADPRGEFLSLVHASPVYALWGYNPILTDEMPPLDQPLIKGQTGYHIRSGKHDLTYQDWHYYMDFADHLWR